MFERFTERARRTLFFARYECSQFGARSIETEHVLLGLIRDGHGLMARVFAHWNVSLGDVRHRLESRIEHRTPISTSIEIPFSADVKRAFDFAREEADRLEHNNIGTGHILLGLMRTEQSLAATLMTEIGMTANTVREILARNDPSELAVSLDDVDLLALSRSVARLQQETAELRERLESLEREVRGRNGPRL